MQDYIDFVKSTQLIITPTGITPATFPYVISRSLTKSHINYLFSLTMIKELSSYKKAIQHPEWIEAINNELRALMRTKPGSLQTCHLARNL